MGKSAPAPTDPKDVSSATTGTNYMTSLINTLMGNFNETGPYGSKTTTQTGTQTVTDPYTGQTYEVANLQGGCQPERGSAELA